MSQAPAQPPLALRIVVIVLIAVGLTGSPIGLWFGVNTILVDQRIQAAGISAQARIVSLLSPRSGNVSSPQTGRAGYVRYELLSQPGRMYSRSVDSETWRGFAVGQMITVQVDPANPDRHMVDRWHEVRTAWIFVAAFGVGCAISLALLVWALRGGINTVGRRV